MNAACLPASGQHPYRQQDFSPPLFCLICSPITQGTSHGALNRNSPYLIVSPSELSSPSLPEAHSRWVQWSANACWLTASSAITIVPASALQVRRKWETWLHLDPGPIAPLRVTERVRVPLTMSLIPNQVQGASAHVVGEWTTMLGRLGCPTSPTAKKITFLIGLNKISSVIARGTCGLR